MTRLKPREAYSDADTLLPELLMVGTDAPRAAATLGLSRHVHPDAWEICYIAQGHVEWWAEEEVHEVGPGEVYVTRPGEPHGGVDAMLHPCELYWLQLRLPAGGRLAGMTAAQSRALTEALAGLTLRRFPATPEVGACFNRLLAEHRQPDRWNTLAARGTLHQLLVHVLRSHEAGMQDQQIRAGAPGEPIRVALAWLEDHYTESFSIEALAERVCLSPTHFHDRFRREVGHTPAQWRTRLRIGLAKRLLREPGLTITDVAMRCGFATSQYFATAFKRLTGLTPRAYREHVRVIPPTT